VTVVEAVQGPSNEVNGGNVALDEALGLTDQLVKIPIIAGVGIKDDASLHPQ
jgi:hypothetical protein